jgi:hypothetical protein
VSALSKSLAGSVYRTLVCGDDIFEYLDRHLLRGGDLD